MNLFFSPTQATINSLNMCNHHFNFDTSSKLTLYNIALTNMYLKGSCAENMIFNKVKINSSVIKSMKFINLEICHESEFIKLDFKEVTLKDVRIRDSHFKDCKMTMLDMSKVTLEGRIIFDKCTQEAANYSNAIFGNDISFNNCNMRHVNFSNAQMNQKMSFVNCDFTEAIFTNVLVGKNLKFTKCTFSCSKKDLEMFKMCKFENCHFKDDNNDNINLGNNTLKTPPKNYKEKDNSLTIN